MIVRKCGARAALLATVSLAVATSAAAQFDYVAGIDVVRGDAAPEMATGTVFHDLSRDGIRQDDEPA